MVIHSLGVQGEQESLLYFCQMYLCVVFHIDPLDEQNVLLFFNGHWFTAITLCNSPHRKIVLPDHLFLFNWQTNSESRSPAEFAFHFDRPLVQVNDFLGNRESQATAFLHTRSRLVGFIKTLEDMRLV